MLFRSPWYVEPHRAIDSEDTPLTSFRPSGAGMRRLNDAVDGKHRDAATVGRHGTYLGPTRVCHRGLRVTMKLLRSAAECASVACGSQAPSVFRRFCNGCGALIATGPSAERPEPRASTPAHLAEKILTSRAALEGERKQVTIFDGARRAGIVES